MLSKKDRALQHPYQIRPKTKIMSDIEQVHEKMKVGIKSQQPQPNHIHAYVSRPMEETHEAPQDHTLTHFGVYLGYTTEGHALSSVPLPNALGGPQYPPPSQPLCFVMGGGPFAIVEKEKFDHIKERLRAIEGEGNYDFADMLKLCLVPDVVIPSKFMVLDFDKYKGTTCSKNHLKMYCRKMGAYAKDEKLLMDFSKKA